ncbi:hypothetical protein J8L85_13600 [Maribacter sp. MMG018]|nr:hypothetical protein [Maribacter sp. MMG018]MBQ4915484.1 hypothetical protein [Maribacter sp. MMG018]
MAELFKNLFSKELMYNVSEAIVQVNCDFDKDDFLANRIANRMERVSK